MGMAKSCTGKPHQGAHLSERQMGKTSFTFATLAELVSSLFPGQSQEQQRQHNYELRTGLSSHCCISFVAQQLKCFYTELVL